MSFIPWVTIAICVVIVTGGLTLFVVMSRMMRKLPGIDEGGDGVEELEKRLSALERRMTDVQDVLISLDEKYRDQLPVDSEAKEG